MGGPMDSNSLYYGDNLGHFPALVRSRPAEQKTLPMECEASEE